MSTSTAGIHDLRSALRRTTRYQSNRDTITILRINGHMLDPSHSPEYDPSLSAKGVSCKTLFDCTVPST
jgi:4-hydroxy-3-polyprenylbenzoate decarboxylase